MAWQQECEELRRNIDSIKDENSSLAQMLKRLSEECLELSNENDSLQVHHLNSTPICSIILSLIVDNFLNVNYLFKAFDDL